MEERRLLATYKIALWKLHHQNELIDVLKKNTPSKQMHTFSILNKVNINVPFSLCKEKGLGTREAGGWMKREL